MRSISRCGAVFLFSFCLFILLFSFSRAALAQDIRVLILDGEFDQIPAAGEKISLMDTTAGKLLLADKPYSGQIEVWRGKEGLYLINKVDLEAYVKSVVKFETGKDWDLEALKAQAVISRTYAVNRLMHSAQMKYDLTSSVLDQAYGGDVQDKEAGEAVDETRGQILVYNGQPIEAFFHSTSCGETEDPYAVFGRHIPYLKPVKVDCGLSPYSAWARRFSAGRIEAALKSGGIDTGDIKDIKIKSRTCTGRVGEMEIDGARGVFDVKAPDARRLLGWKALPSTEFSVQFSDGSWEFEGKGYGHGVGLCQWSALEMARQGESYQQILAYFYPGTKLEIWK
ncbi:MAG: SpoIID/LytB domain-containing protein [Nitrospiraceae bacterium]|nr:SpoIID/LytB domain-containing protein [Nitrospiraceae bacterium]